METGTYIHLLYHVLYIYESETDDDDYCYYTSLELLISYGIMFSLTTKQHQQHKTGRLLNRE
jgi:hypothetical protein